jgi:hypothetical protein
MLSRQLGRNATHNLVFREIYCANFSWYVASVRLIRCSSCVGSAHHFRHCRTRAMSNTATKLMSLGADRARSVHLRSVRGWHNSSVLVHITAKPTVVWNRFQNSFEGCRGDLEEIGAENTDLAQMTRFYESCLARFPPPVPDCEESNLGEQVGFQVVNALSVEDNACHLDLGLLVSVCGSQLQECVSALRSQAVQQNVDMSQQISGCPGVFLGPDIGFAAVTSLQPSGTCRPVFDSLVQACANHAAQCITFLDLEESIGQAPELPPQGPTATVRGWCLLSAPRDVLDVGSDVELIFVSLLRNDLAVSAGVSMNTVSVVAIEEAIANEEGETVHVHVSVELTVGGDAEEASTLLQELIDQSTDPASQLLQGSITSSMEHMGEERGTPSRCEAVFLGPDIGFVNVME